MSTRIFGAMLMASLLAFAGCSCSDKNDYRNVGKYTPRTKTTTNVQTKSYLLNSNDFDLATITSMVRDNKVGSAEELEKFINSDNGVNNVDIDKDGNIDYIQVVENQGDGIVLDFRAIPSKTGNVDEAVTVSTLRFSRNTATNEVEVSGGYPEYVDGHSNHYYNYRTPYRPGLSMGDALFLAWMFSPTRTVYAPVYRPGFYTPRVRYGSAQLASKRTTTRTTTKVSPIKKASKPASYKSSKHASKTASKFKATSKAKGNSFSSRAGASKSYSKRSATKERKKATGFGASRKKPSSSTGGWGSSSSSKRKSSGWGSSSSSRKKKSSWGSSSRKKSRGWGSSSSSRSRSRGGFGRRRR